MVQSLLSNFAIIFLMHIVIEKFESMRTVLNHRWIDALYVIAVSVSVVSMFYLPISFGEFNFDLRLIPLVFAAFSKRRSIVIVILLITVFFRWVMGGQGATPGIIFGLILPTLVAMQFPVKELCQRKLPKVLIIVTLAWMISDIPAIFIIPDGWDVFKQMAVPRYCSLIVATIAMFFLIYDARKRLSLQKQLLYNSTHDQLTGVWNKKSLLEIARKRMLDREVAYIAMIDVDYFKYVNDRFGHMTGDLVLKEIAGLLNLPETGIYAEVGRYGGEEFICYLEVDSQDEAIAYFDRVRKMIKNTQFYSVNDEPIFNITISIGFSVIESTDTIDRDLEKADQFVYQAKGSGRNCIIY